MVDLMFEHGTPFQGRLRPPYNWVEDTVKQPRPVQNDHCVCFWAVRKCHRKNESTSGHHGLDVSGYMHDTMGTTESSEDANRSESQKVSVLWIES